MTCEEKNLYEFSERDIGAAMRFHVTRAANMGGQLNKQYDEILAEKGRQELMIINRIEEVYIQRFGSLKFYILYLNILDYLKQYKIPYE